MRVEKKIKEKDMRDGLTEQEETGRGERKSMWTRRRRTGGGRKIKKAIKGSGRKSNWTECRRIGCGRKTEQVEEELAVGGRQKAIRGRKKS